MIITRTSLFTGKVHNLDLPVTESQLDAYYGGTMLIQNAFPNLNADEREFIMTGVTAEEWRAAFGEEE